MKRSMFTVRRLAGVLSLVGGVFLVLHIFGAESPFVYWPISQTSRAGLLQDAALAHRDGTHSELLASKATSSDDHLESQSDDLPSGQGPLESSANTTVPPGGELRSIRDLWFASAEQARALEASVIPIVTKGNCSAALRDAKESKVLGQRYFPLNATSDVPLSTTTHVLEASLFMTMNQSFVQVQAVWNRNTPSTYRISAMAFSSPQFEGAPQDPAMSLFDPSVSYDLASVRDIFSAAAARSTSPVRLLQHVSHFDGTSEKVMRFIGRLPLSYDDDGESCSLTLSSAHQGHQFVCLCRFQ